MSGPWNSNSSASFPPSLTPSVLTAPCPSSSSSGRVMGQSWRALMNCTGAHYHHHDLSGSIENGGRLCSSVHVGETRRKLEFLVEHDFRFITPHTFHQRPLIPSLNCTPRKKTLMKILTKRRGSPNGNIPHVLSIIIPL